ncbi:MAG: hypothetical protein HIU86_00945 [Acidobacteria bacterium]|nr:hypothetical protein [Acidobacteriota bacterium]
MEVQGPRRETSRHRSASRFAIPRPAGRLATILTPAVSLLPAVVALVVVQSLNPAAQRVPTGAARFDLTGAWLATEPGAVAGTTSWLAAPTLGRLQLGALLRVLQGGQSQSVLAAAHGGMLLLTVVQAVLLWWVLRRLSVGGVGAGLATALFGVAPIAIGVHTAVSAVAVAACWLLLAAGLTLGVTRAERIAGGVAAAVAVASAPAVAIVLLPLAVLLALRLRRERRALGGPWARAALSTAAGFVVAAVLIALVMAIAAALPSGAATARLDALTTAQDATPVGGFAAIVLWAGSDPLSLLVAVGAVVLAAVAARDRAITVLVAVGAVASIWPQGGDPVPPLVVLLPLVAAAVARSVDVGVAALGHPLFVRSVLGSAWLTAVGAVLVVAVVAWVVGLSALVRGGDLPVTKVERWVAASVPAGQTVLVGLGVYPDLVGTAKAQVGWYGSGNGATAVPSSVPWSRADYIVVDGSLPSDRTGAAATALGRSLEVATFGTGSAELSVRAVRQAGASVPLKPPTTAAGRAAAALRKSVGMQLAENPRIQLDGRDRALLLAGAVDTRIAIVLAQFVTSHSIAVSGFGVASGDASGIRTVVTISEIDGRNVPSDGTKTGVLLRFLSDLRGQLATRSIDATDSGISAAFRPEPDLIPTG